MGTCRLLLLGPPRIEKDGQTVLVALRKAIALTAYLAVEQRAFSREYLASLLWPDHGQEGAMANLRRTLSFLREKLGHSCVAVENDQVRIDRSAVTVDIDEFHALAAPQGPQTDLSSLAAAAAFYRGSFLEGFSLGRCPDFDEWQDAARERLRSEYDDLLETLTSGYMHEGRLTAALPFARRWLELDSLNEAAHRALIEIHARTGRWERARKQLESCTRALAREKLEPDERTRALGDAIKKHRLPPTFSGISVAHGAPADSPTRRQGILRRGWRRRVFVGALVLAAVAAVNLYALRFLIFPGDLSVVDIEVSRAGTELSQLHVALRSDGGVRRSVDYAVVFSSDPALVARRDYVVYSGEVMIGRNADVMVEIDRRNDIQRYLDARDVSIPPGDYFPAVMIDPDWKIGERSELNNRRAADARFFFPGTDPGAAFGVEIRYRGNDTLDAANPLKVFVGDRTLSRGLENWGRFVVSREGRYYFPVEDIPQRDNDGSGYFLIIVHDVRNDLEHPMFIAPGDAAAIYKQVTGGLVYGVFGVACGSPVFPGGMNSVEFSPPPSPMPDAYETDDVEKLGTVIGRADRPVRQHHTFHDDGTGDTDEDWFRISVLSGDSLTVETFSAGGLWECDTAIDISDANMNYLRSANDKSLDDCYSRLSYANETGADQVLHILVRPYVKYNPTANRVGEYIVEFRR